LRPRHTPRKVRALTPHRPPKPEAVTEAAWLALIVGFLVQGYKGVADYLRTGRWNLRRFVETGGMPSSHAASVSALTTWVAVHEGFRSPMFGVTLYFSLIVMYDAAGLRRAAGRQAAILNRLVEEHFRHPERETQRLMELLGHTPFEVAIGALLGIASALAWEWIR
jgi:acid phosphatase family membrane protein YuiD